MKPAVQVNCPNCHNLLRVPPDMVDISVKCKHCGYVLQIKKKAGKTPAAPAPKAAAPQQTTAGWQQQATAGQLPEYTPPAAAAPAWPMAGAGTAKGLPMPLVEELPETAASDYNPAFEGAGQRYAKRGGYKGPRRDNSKMKLMMVGGIVLLGVIVMVVVLIKQSKPHETIVTDGGKTIDPARNTSAPPTVVHQPVSVADPKGGVKPTPADQTAPVPRRLLGIGIFDYLYCNPILYGKNKSSKESDRRDFFKALDLMADNWRIPKTQRYFVSDSPGEKGLVDETHPPLKMVVAGTIDRFLSTCRPQDRIVLVFAGHAIEQEGEVYLVPLEGEFEDLTSLIPLKEVYAKLGKCAAQEKFVIFDVCRFDKGRGVERPAFGMMTEPMEKAFHNCPEGVTVWTSCSAGQYSYEAEQQETGSVPRVRNELYGPIFFALFFPGNSFENLFSKRQNGGGIHHPSDPLPIAPVTTWINEKTEAVSKDLYAAQVPKVTSKARKDWLAYDPKEPLAAHMDLAKPPATVKREEVAAMFKELSLPDIRSIRKTTDNARLADNFPFTEEQLKDFFNDSGPGYAEIAKAPAQFAKTYPLRAAAVEAIEEMRKLKQDDSGQGRLPETFSAPINDKKKADITNIYQRTIAERQGTLEGLKDNLASAGKKRDMEKSKRWQATYDYAYAQVRARYAYIFEYNLALGNVKTDKLPELDTTKKQSGWKLASIEKMTAPKEIRDEAEEAKNTFGEIAKTYANTPWAVMAKSQKNMAFGLKWEPEGGEAESK